MPAGRRLALSRIERPQERKTRITDPEDDHAVTPTHSACALRSPRNPGEIPPRRGRDRQTRRRVTSCLTTVDELCAHRKPTAVARTTDAPRIRCRSLRALPQPMSENALARRQHPGLVDPRSDTAAS
jgi:hypothetical protein